MISQITAIAAIPAGWRSLSHHIWGRASSSPISQEGGASRYVSICPIGFGSLWQNAVGVGRLCSDRRRMGEMPFPHRQHILRPLRRQRPVGGRLCAPAFAAAPDGHFHHPAQQEQG
jgi:hypothetical protein